MGNRKAVVLLSGGLDSATTLAIALQEFDNIYPVSFNYGQKHSVEIEFSKKIVKSYNLPNHLIIDLSPEIFSGSSLSKKSTEDVPRNSYDPACSNIPTTYVPARNIIFLSYALACLETIDARHIFIGVNSVDYSGYPDCRPEFISSFQEMANIGTRIGDTGGKIKIMTPLIGMKKSEIIKKGTELGVDYSLTISCYSPDEDGLSCGSCDSCIIRKNGFLEAGISDPTLYQK